MCTAVLATKDPNLLIHRSSAVAGELVLGTCNSGDRGLWWRAQQCMFAVGGPEYAKVWALLRCSQTQPQQQVSHDSKHETLLHDILY